MPLFQAAPPISYSRQVAPILALHCSSCHGDSSGLSTRSYTDLIRGGNMGKVVVPGDPDASLLVHFIDGRRGEAHRMPLGGRRLSDEQIQIIRRWIAEGAKEDAATTAPRVIVIQNQPIGPGDALDVFCRIASPAWLTLTVQEPGGKRTLLEETATVKSPKDPGDTAAPGELFSWRVRAGAGWPKAVDLVLKTEHSEAAGAEFFARPAAR